MPSMDGVLGLGWWVTESSDAESAALENTYASIWLREQHGGKWFGIDVGKAGT